MKYLGTSAIGAAALLALCGAAVATNYDPTGQAGQYEHTKLTTVVRGAGQPMTAKLWAPWLLFENDAAQNSAVVQTDSSGVPYGAVTTFGGTLATPFRGIAAFGTTDAAGFGGTNSNNTFVTEGVSTRSNSFGELIDDGTPVWRANFSSLVQNNLEFSAPIPWPASTAPTSGGTKVFGAFPGIDEEFGGTVQLGTPGAERAGGVLYTGVTTFDGGTFAVPNGTNVYAGTGNNPNAPFATWLQSACPAPSVPAGQTSADARQTQPVLRRVVTDCNPSGDLYIAFGVGFSGTTITGGSARPTYIVVDRVNASNFGDGFAFIEADGDNDLSTANPDIRFIDHQATGGGGGPFVGGQFSINRKGQVVATIEDRTVSPRGFRVVRYDPVFDGACNITGYSAPVVIATAGQDTIAVNVLNTVGANTFILNPFSGAGIDDDGNISFAAITEVFEDVDGLGNPVLLGTTNTLFFYHAASDTLHAVAHGGQNGDVLPNLGAGPALKVGFFPVDGASDNMIRAGLSSTGMAMALCFRNRSAGNPSFPGFIPSGGEFVGGAAVRGVLVAQVEKADEVPCPGDTNGDGVIDFTDFSTVLAAYGACLGDPGYNPDADFDKSGCVDFPDFSAVLAVYGQNCP